MMKKWLLLLFFCFISCLRAQAGFDFMDRCPASSSKFNYMMPKFVEQIAQNIVRDELKKALGVDFDVKIKAFTIPELISGKIESMEFKGENISIYGFYFSSLKVKTLCPYSSIDLKSRPIKPKENAVLGVWAEVNSSDLIKTISYSDYIKTVNSANLSSIGISSYYLYPSSVSIENGKLYFMIHAIPIGPHSPLDISVGADFRVQNAQMVSSQITLINLYTGYDLSQFADFLKVVHNWLFEFNSGASERAQIQIRNIHLVGEKAYIDAQVFLPK